MSQEPRLAPTPHPRLPADERSAGTVTLHDSLPGESIASYLRRTDAGPERVKEILGAANPFKEGDVTVGVAAADERSRAAARELIAHTPLRTFDEVALLDDSVRRYIRATTEPDLRRTSEHWTVGDLKRFVLERPANAIEANAPGWSSDAIAAVVKLMTHEELTAVGAKLENRMPGRDIGARGVLGARVQPNSPTDHPEDIRWQVFSAFSYAVGDVVLGTNPVSSRPEDVARIQRTLKDLVETFELDDVLPWCVLSHIDVQAEVEAREPGLLSTVFQSLGGCDGTNRTFGLTVEKLREYARCFEQGLYFETGQGADFTNGAGDGLDMVLLESRKYGLARGLASETRGYVHVNDVAGFIGPEVFRTREQLVRCCLEDIVMAKLHGLCFGLDVCATLHMSLSPADLDWCLDQVIPAAPAYLMALPTKNDPMLSYMTTGYQDHVRLRERFGLRPDGALAAFFERLGVLDAEGRPTEHAGDPLHVYAHYRRAKGDKRSEDAIRAEGEAHIAAVEARDVPIARGHGGRIDVLAPEMERELWRSFEDAQASLVIDLEPSFIARFPEALELRSTAERRAVHNLEPKRGERLDASSIAALRELRASWDGASPDVILMVSDGLNARAVMDPGHLGPFLTAVRSELASLHVADRTLFLHHGRVRAGYAAAQVLFANGHDDAPRALVHFIGERPGTRHQNASVYLTAPTGARWARGDVDHDETRVISGVSDTALTPEQAALRVAELLRELRAGVH